MRLPSLNALYCFSVVGRCLSFKTAAENLFISQAAVSQQIKKLEDELGVKLFTRHGNSTQLTISGRHLLSPIHNAFQQMEFSIGELKSINTHRLDVSCPHTFSTYCLVPRLREFQLNYPEIALHLSPDNHLLSASNFKADVAIRIGGSVNKGLETRELVKSEFVLAYPSAIAKDDVALSKIIKKAPFFLDESEDIVNSLRKLCEKLGIEFESLNFVLRVSDSSPVINNLVAGNGIGLVNSVLIKDHLKNKQLFAYKGEVIRGKHDIYVTAPPENFKSDKVSKFLSWLFAQDFDNEK